MIGIAIGLTFFSITTMAADHRSRRNKMYCRNEIVVAGNKENMESDNRDDTDTVWTGVLCIVFEPTWFKERNTS